MSLRRTLFGAIASVALVGIEVLGNPGGDILRLIQLCAVFKTTPKKSPRDVGIRGPRCQHIRHFRIDFAETPVAEHQPVVGTI